MATVISGCISQEPDAASAANSFLQHCQRGTLLATAARDPAHVGLVAAMAALVGNGNRLVVNACRQHDLLQGIAPGFAAGWQQRAIRTNSLIQVIQDRRAVDEHLAVVQDKRRHAPDRVVGAQSIGIAEHRQELALERHAEQVQGMPTRRTKGES